MEKSSPPLPKTQKRRGSMDDPPSVSSSSGPLTKELQCPICLDVFTDPVSTPCGHSFCKTCLNMCWNNSQTCNCPYCKETFKIRPDLKINTTLREVVDHYKMKSPEVLCDFCEERKLKALKSCLVCQSSYCETHLEPHLKVAGLKQHKLINPVRNLGDYICQKHVRPLELFCRDDQTIVCLSCTDGDHKNHNTVSLEEEIEEKKTQLKRHIDVQQMIQERSKKIQEIKHSSEVRKIYSSLCSSRNTRNWSEISVKTDDSQETVRRVLTQLQDTLQEKLTLTDSTDLKRMQQYKVDVTLDPDTAHPGLILSDDGKQVRDGDIEQKLPDKPESFNPCPCVLGKEGFSSGRFYFEVQVKGKTEWDLGVARESINKKGLISLRPSNGFWTVILRNGNEYKAGAGPPVSLCLRVKPQRVGVFVDYEEGLVSFYDVESSSHIYSFTGQSFTGKLYPYFSPGPINGCKNSTPLIITPVSYNK
ncbi:zinc finger protein RFP-like isoform X3 [Megalobrama amblycephala]|uniref:zinc finger protein RFP-like isoform X3 n=1 Tax=Megalobrama amblycephala TaxID=75352 RepID=UPI002013CDCC|nr:zinc finger protein RFP-like isoform X3 [Megalobrama amblycephala]